MGKKRKQRKQREKRPIPPPPEPAKEGWGKAALAWCALAAMLLIILAALEMVREGLLAQA